MGQTNCWPSIWCSKYYFFFMISCKILCRKGFKVFSFYKFTKIKIKSFQCLNSIRNYKKNNAWNIWHLVNDPFVSTNQRPSVLYCRLTNFRDRLKKLLVIGLTIFRLLWFCQFSKLYGSKNNLILTPFWDWLLQSLLIYIKIGTKLPF